MNTTSYTVDCRPVSVALVGCGAVSQLYYTPALQELEKQRLLHVRALYDPNMDNLKQLQRAFPDALVVRDLAELSVQQLDLAIVASPPQYHAEQTIQLLGQGLSVLCEKPMATSVVEAEAMIAAAATAPGHMAVGLFRRFFPATQTIHRILSLGILGDIVAFHFVEGGVFRWPVQSPAYFRKTTANGGVLMDIGVHVLDLMIWWLGYPEAIDYEDDAMGGIEANCRLQCHFLRGTTGQIRLSRDCDLPNRYVIHGTKGWLSWEIHQANQIQLGFADAPFALTARTDVLLAEQPLPIVGQPGFNFEQSFTSQLANLVAAIQGREALVVSGEQGIQSLRLIEDCYRQRTLMPMPWMSEGELSSAQQLNGLRTSA